MCLRLALWLSIAYGLSWSVPCALQKNVCFAVVGWNVLEMSVRSSQLIVLFKSSISLFIICLVVPSIVKSGVLKGPSTTANLLYHVFEGIMIPALQSCRDQECKVWWHSQPHSGYCCGVAE